MVVPSASEADAVIWADCPLAMSSAIVLASPSESVGVETSNSSWSVMAMLNVSVVVVESSLEVYVTVTLQVLAAS